METWLRNSTETDFMITCNHVSADGQFDSDASATAGAVNSERLYGGKKSVSLYYIVFMYRRHWKDDVWCAIFCFMNRNNIMHVCSDAISHFNVFS